MATEAEQEAAEKAAAAKAAEDGKKSPEMLEAEKNLASAQADVEKWKAMSRKHEGQAKENAEAAKRLKDAEDAKKTAEERLASKVAELESKVNATEARALRAEVAASKGLTPAQAKRLVGTTAEELEADADELLATFKPADTGGESDKGESSGKPKEALKGGASSDGMQEKPDLKQVLAEILERVREVSTLRS